MHPEILTIELGMVSMYLAQAAEYDPSNPASGAYQLDDQAKQHAYAKRNRALMQAAGFAAGAGVEKYQRVARFVATADLAVQVTAARNDTPSAAVDSPKSGDLPA